MQQSDWLAILAYLTVIFANFNNLNTSLQGRNVSLFGTADKTDGIKLKAWKFCTSRNCYKMLQHLTSVFEDAEENLNVKTIQNTIVEHLIERIQHYFPEENDPQRGYK